MLEYLDISLFVLFGVSFGSSGGSGQSQQTQTQSSGLDPAFSRQLSAFIQPALRNLYTYAAGHLLPQPRLMPAFDTSGARVINSLTGQDRGSTADTSLSVYGDPTYGSFVPDPNSPVTPAHTFQLPSVDANGLYGAQTGAVDDLLSRAYANLDTTGSGNSVVRQALPSLMSMIGAQTANQVTIPETVRQRRVADLNAVLQLSNAALGSQSAGSGFNTRASNQFNASLFGGSGGNTGPDQEGPSRALQYLQSFSKE